MHEQSARLPAGQRHGRWLQIGLEWPWDEVCLALPWCCRPQNPRQHCFCSQPALWHPSTHHGAGHEATKAGGWAEALKPLGAPGAGAVPHGEDVLQNECRRVAASLSLPASQACTSTQTVQLHGMLRHCMGNMPLAK